LEGEEKPLPLPLCAALLNPRKEKMLRLRCGELDESLSGS
jgi:hypothetical protein